MKVWPHEILPQFDTNLTGGIDDNSRRVTMESGTTRQRQLFTKSRVVLNAQWTLDVEQFRVFRGFIEHEIKEGADKFLMWFQMGGFFWHEVRIVNGDYSVQRSGAFHYVVSAQLETTFIAGFCTPNLTSFLTIPFGDVDLSMYFGTRVSSPFAATEWRLISDDCGFQIEYYRGTINEDGTLNPGTNTNEDNGEFGFSGWLSAEKVFHSTYSYTEGIYMQLNCGDKWSNRPCIEGGNTTGIGEL